MNRCPQEGHGKSEKITQGDTVRDTVTGITGSVDAFFGGSHTGYSIKSGGYTYSGDTRNLEKVKK